MRSPLILIAEDCPETRACYAELFHSRGFRVATAENGAEALLAVQLRRPDVVLTDLDMPLLDGIGLTIRLRERGETASVPIVAVTGSGLNRIVQRARESGCDAVVLKPCAPNALLDLVDRLLSPGATTDEASKRKRSAA